MCSCSSGDKVKHGESNEELLEARVINTGLGFAGLIIKGCELRTSVP